MRVATFNILHGASSVDGRVVPGHLADAVASTSTCVALQEVDRRQLRSAHADLAAAAAEAMGAVEHRFVAALGGPPDGHWSAANGREDPAQPAYGIAVASRYPVRSWKVLRLPTLRVPAPSCRPVSDGRSWCVRSRGSPSPPSSRHRPDR